MEVTVIHTKSEGKLKLCLLSSIIWELYMNRSKGVAKSVKPNQCYWKPIDSVE